MNLIHVFKSVDELRAEGFDKVILAVGASKPGTLRLRRRRCYKCIRVPG